VDQLVALQHADELLDFLRASRLFSPLDPEEHDVSVPLTVRLRAVHSVEAG